MVTLADIFSWFETGDFPTQQEFRDTFSSFWHKSEKIPGTQIEGSNSLMIFVEKIGINALIYPKHFAYNQQLTVKNVILANNAVGASFSVDGVTYDENSLIGITVPENIDLVFEDIDIAAGFDTGSLTILF